MRRRVVVGAGVAWITADTGYQSPPPIVAGGCVFINTQGHIEALDLQDGHQVPRWSWRHECSCAW